MMTIGDAQAALRGMSRGLAEAAEVFDALERRHEAEVAQFRADAARLGKAKLPEMLEEHRAERKKSAAHSDRLSQKILAQATRIKELEAEVARLEDPALAPAPAPQEGDA